MAENRKGRTISKFFRKQILNLSFLDRRLFVRDIADNQEQKLCPYEKLDHLYDLGRDRSDSLCSAPSSPSIASHRLSKYMEFFPDDEPSLRLGESRSEKRDVSPLRSERSLSAPSSPNHEAAYYEAIPLLEGFYEATSPSGPVPNKGDFAMSSPVPFNSKDLPTEWLCLSSKVRKARNSISNSVEAYARDSANLKQDLERDTPQLPLTSSRRFFFGGPRRRRHMMMLYHQQQAYHQRQLRKSISPTALAASSRHRPRNLKDLLERLNLKLLLPLLSRNGVTNLAAFKSLTAAKLTEMGIHDIQSRVKVLTAIDLISDEEDIPEEVDEMEQQQPQQPLPPIKPITYENTNVITTRSNPPSNVPHGMQQIKKEKSSCAFEKARGRSRSSIPCPSSSQNSGKSKQSVKFNDTGGRAATEQSSTTVQIQQLPKDALKLANSNILPQTHNCYVSSPFPFMLNTLHQGGAPPAGQAFFNITPASAFHPVQPCTDGIHSRNCKSPSALLQPPPSRASCDNNTGSGDGNAAMRPPTRAEVVFTANLELKLKDMLETDSIDLTKKPYSGEDGVSSIPLRLIERYAEELQQNVQQVALILEKIREQLLREDNRSVVTHMEDILNHRFLNCVGISTDTLENFLTSIGLPQYLHRLNPVTMADPSSQNTSQAAAVDGNTSTSSKLTLLTPRELMTASECDLVHKYGIHVNHVKYILRESWMVNKNTGPGKHHYHHHHHRLHHHHHYHHQTLTSSSGNTPSAQHHRQKNKSSTPIPRSSSTGPSHKSVDISGYLDKV